MTNLHFRFCLWHDYIQDAPQPWSHYNIICPQECMPWDGMLTYCHHKRNASVWTSHQRGTGNKGQGNPSTALYQAFSSLSFFLIIGSHSSCRLYISLDEITHFCNLCMYQMALNYIKNNRRYTLLNICISQPIVWGFTSIELTIHMSIIWQ